MAMTEIEKRHFRSAIPDVQIAEAIITVIDSGSAASLPARALTSIRNAFASAVDGDSFNAAITTGSALSESCKASFRRILCSAALGTTIATQVDALT